MMRLATTCRATRRSTAWRRTSTRSPIVGELLASDFENSSQARTQLAARGRFGGSEPFNDLATGRELTNRVMSEVDLRDVRCLDRFPLQPTFAGRSEEHTSELQSRFDIVCRLMLAKRKLK